MSAYDFPFFVIHHSPSEARPISIRGRGHAGNNGAKLAVAPCTNEDTPEESSTLQTVVRSSLRVNWWYPHMCLDRMLQANSPHSPSFFFCTASSRSFAASSAACASLSASCSRQYCQVRLRNLLMPSRVAHLLVLKAMRLLREKE